MHQTELSNLMLHGRKQPSMKRPAAADTATSSKKMRRPAAAVAAPEVAPAVAAAEMPPPEPEPAEGMATRNDYAILLYRKDTLSIGIREKFGACKQIFSFGRNSGKTEVQLKEIAKQVVAHLHAGNGTASALAKANDLCR